MSEFSNQISEKALSNIPVDSRSPIFANAPSNLAGSVNQPQIFITINAAPNMNEQELASKVGQEVSRYFRGQQNSYRNSYRDID